MNNENINNVNITSNTIKTINTIIKDLSISPQKKLYIYLDSKPTIQENNNYKYYLYDIKDMFLKSNNKDDTKKINKEYTPQ